MFVLFDLETGGLNPEKNPILQGFFLVTDEKLTPIEEFEFYVKPSTIPEGLRNIEEEALKVNNLSLEHLENIGIGYTEALKHLESFLLKYKPIQPVGYNVLFDISFLAKNIQSINSIFSHKYVDIYSAVNFLKLCDIVPQSIGSLGSLGRSLGVSPSSALHNAKADVYYLRDVVLKLAEEVRLRSSKILGLDMEDASRILINLNL